MKMAGFVKYGAIKAFLRWVDSRGGIVLEPIHDAELARFCAASRLHSIVAAGAMTNPEGSHAWFVNNTTLALWNAWRGVNPLDRKPMDLTPVYHDVGPFAARKALRKAAAKKIGDRCFYCGCEFTEENQATLEHLLALNTWGSFAFENCTAACADCNSAAGSAHLIDKFELRDELHVARAGGASEEELARIRAYFIELHKSPRKAEL
jgi:hypothetical protein